MRQTQVRIRLFLSLGAKRPLYKITLRRTALRTIFRLNVNDFTITNKTVLYTVLQLICLPLLSEGDKRFYYSTCLVLVLFSVPQFTK